ncbi:uncharacterized protein LOC117653736 [Thrips palmi]|uniref:Uncharacterized protein LOC117653736 n=1 Tax=Thrips palmi TaxID=161013 RepID=A0A6P9ABJ0_THRPL|nr:uncharacterized protein LOC117653736 [Thrips palmi]
MDAKKEQEKPAVRMARLLKDKLVPRMVEEGVFGSTWQVQAIEAVPIGGLGEDHWASTTLSTTLQLVEKNNNAKTRSVALVTKCMLESDCFDGYANPAVLADNEVAMYTKILPFLTRLGDGAGVTLSDLYPKCYFAESNMQDLLSLTVMQDLRADGYSLAKSRCVLDKNHVMLSMQAIGRFHAFSYAAKARCRRELLETMVPLLRETNFTPAWDEMWGPKVKGPMLRGLTRAEARLKAAKDGDKDRHQRRLERLARMRAVADNAFPVMKAAVAVQEPASVIVHGDFCRNNMAFHYGKAGPDGPADGVCLFDFQTSRYCSPSVDLSFFIFLNTSAALRAEHWDDLFLEYFGSLKATLDRLLDGHPIDKDFVMPTLQGVHEDFRRHALMAYVICSFFLPQMMLPPEEIVDIEEIKETFARDGGEALMASMLDMGGEEATEALADMVMDFLDRDLVP